MTLFYMIHSLKMTVLADNKAAEPLLSQWGLCVLIEADGKRLLLDTGGGDVFAQNARLLGIDLSCVDLGVLSHAHYDHGDGLEVFFSENASAPFLLSDKCRENCFGLKEGEMKYIGIRRGIMEANSRRLKYVSGVYEVSDGVWIVPHRKKDYSGIALRNDLYIKSGDEYLPEDFAHEQSLVFETEKGLVLFSSCSHTGFANVLLDVKEALGREDVFAFVGGLHLYKLTDDELFSLSREIEKTGVRHIFTGHCTGDHAFELLKDRLGDRVQQFYSGFRYSFL